LPYCARLLVASLARRPDALAATLQVTAETARKSGHLAAADAALGRVRALIQSAAAADPGAGAPLGAAAAAATPRVPLQAWWRSVARPDAPWLLEAVKLMWDRGQAAAALRELHGLVAAVERAGGGDGGGKRGGGAAAEAAAGAGGGAAARHRSLARLLSLAGKWTAATQHGGGKTAAVMELMSRGAEALRDGGGGGEGRLACAVYFRLAAFADERYK
jgi:hypothetical protein